MVFKQGVSKEEKERIIGLTVMCLFWGGMLTFAGLKQHSPGGIYVVSIIALMLIVFLLYGLISCEWFYIYEDRIEVRNVYRKKNIVYFKDVLFVQEASMRVSNYGRIDCYIFNDGRVDYKDNFITSYRCHLNKKKYNLRIYKTDKLKDYITNVLKLEIAEEKIIYRK